MSITTILFDLDGTLLPMDQDEAWSAYLKGLTVAAEPAGYSPKFLALTIMDGIAAMGKNNGEKSNEAVFWDTLEKTYGESIRKDAHLFDEFYAADFQKLKDICGFAPRAAELIDHIREKGYRVVLATNPLFPRVATESRVRWAGLDPEVFELISTYENARYCKPDLRYYTEILNQLQVTPEECVMVGNDVSQDMAAEQLGMKVFLITDCLINTGNKDISVYPHGNMDDLFAFIDALE